MDRGWRGDIVTARHTPHPAPYTPPNQPPHHINPPTPSPPHLDAGGSCQGLGEADHAHVISVLLESTVTAVGAVTAVQTRQTRVLVSHAPTRMAARQRAHARVLCMHLKPRTKHHSQWMTVRREDIHPPLMLQDGCLR